MKNWSKAIPHKDCEQLTSKVCTSYLLPNYSAPLFEVKYKRSCPKPSKSNSVSQLTIIAIQRNIIWIQLAIRFADCIHRNQPTNLGSRSSLIKHLQLKQVPNVYCDFTTQLVITSPWSSNTCIYVNKAIWTLTEPVLCSLRTSAFLLLFSFRASALEPSAVAIFGFGVFIFIPLKS